MDQSCAARSLRAVHELHAFVADWLAGRIERDDAGRDRFADALADQFLVVHPSGRCDDKTSLCAALWRAYGSEGASFDVEIRRPRSRVLAATTCLVLYEEWHVGQQRRGRICSAWLRELADDRVVWEHLHQTSLGGADGAARS